MKTDKGYLTSLVWLRCGCMLYIVGFWHLLNYVDGVEHVNPTTSRITITCLSVFFFVSGHLLGRSNAVGFTDFFSHRFARIYPPVVAVTLIFLFMQIGTWDQHLRNVFLISAFFEPAPPTLWFASMICLFYLATPFLIRLRDRAYFYWAALCGTLLLLVACQRMFNTIDERLIMYLPCFAVGLFFAGKPLPKRRHLGLLAASTVLGLAISSFTSGVESILLVPWALTSSWLIVALTTAVEDYLPEWPVVSAISLASFFMYLFHRPVYEATLLLWSPDQTWAAICWLVLFGVPLLFFVSWALQRGYNSLFIGSKRRHVA